MATKPLWRSRVPKLYRRRAFLLRLFGACFILLPVALWLFLIFTSVARFPAQLRDAKLALVVVAHPDDESLFFGPTILSLTQRRAAGLQTGLLVLSSGTFVWLPRSPSPAGRASESARDFRIYLARLTRGALLGNHYGKGDIRKAEVKAACAVLGIQKDHCDVLDLQDMQDDPERTWPRETVGAIVREYVSRWSADAVRAKDLEHHI